MAENNMPDKAEQPVLDNTAEQNAPGLTTEKAESPAHEGAGASASPKPAPSREPIPIFKENTISTMSGPEKPAPAHHGRPKAEKAPEAPAVEDNRPPWEKPAASTVKKAVAPKDAPAPTEEVPSVPREAPRPVAAEQVVFIPLSELYPFKDHPFGVRDDKEMRSLAESVKEKGVNQPALLDKLTRTMPGNSAMNGLPECQKAMSRSRAKSAGGSRCCALSSKRKPASFTPPICFWRLSGAIPTPRN